MPIPEHVRPRLRVNRDTAKIGLTAFPGDPIEATDSEIDAALSEINQDSVYDEIRGQLTVQVWDRKSPINGVPAEHFLDRDDVDENGNHDIYLISRDGQVVAFQPHEPGVEGVVRIPKGSGLARGNNHADNIAADVTAFEVVRRVRGRIVEARGPVQS